MGISIAPGLFRMAKRTPFYARHLVLGAKMVDFGGWDLPLQYGSQLQEHHQARNAAGLFDASHLTIVDFPDPVATRYLLRYLYDHDRAIGVITSGAFSPALNRGIALARVTAGVGERCQVEVRGKP